MEIVFVRHGQTDLNRSGCIQGSSTNEILNGVGREAKLFNRLAK